MHILDLFKAENHYKEQTKSILYGLFKNLALLRKTTVGKFSYQVIDRQRETTGEGAGNGLAIHNANQELQVTAHVRQRRIGRPREQGRIVSYTGRGPLRHSEIE